MSGVNKGLYVDHNERIIFWLDGMLVQGDTNRKGFPYKRIYTRLKPYAETTASYLLAPPELFK